MLGSLFQVTNRFLTIISEAHDTIQSVHSGIHKAFSTISESYYWPNCFRDIVTYVRNCDICQACKVDQSTPPGLMGQRIIEEP